MITRREDVILAAMEHEERLTGRCIHHGDAIGDAELSRELAALAAQVERVKKAARQSLEKQRGGTPLPPQTWSIGEAVVK